MTNLRTTDDKVNVSALTSDKKFYIASADTVILKSFTEEGKLRADELAMLSGALRNAPGNQFGAFWNANAAALAANYDYLKVRRDDTTVFVQASRAINPLIFEQTPTSTPLYVRTVAVLAPSKISPWWMAGYLLSITISPMREYSYGALVVSVLDKDGKTLGVRVVGLMDSEWFSAVLPGAICCGSAPLRQDAIFFGDRSQREGNLLINAAVQATAAAMVGPAQNNSSSWQNLQAALIESLAIGNDTAVFRLLCTGRRDRIGGNDLNGYFYLMGED